MIEIRLHGELAVGGRRSLAVPEGPGEDLLGILRAQGLEGGAYAVLVLNGRLVTAQAVPTDGDVVDVYPPLAGG